MRYILIFIISLVLFSCRSTEDHGHTHDADGGHGEETLSQDTTLWTDMTELFVEFPVLVVGRPSRFAAHFTRLERHRPVLEGRVTVSLIKDQRGIRHTVEEPVAPGIFAPTLQPNAPGIYQLVIDLETPEYRDRIVVDGIQVFASLEDARRTLPIEDDFGGAIAFLKEQAWKLDFQTARVIKGEIYDVINTSGVWKSAPGTTKTLIANAGGVVGLTDLNLIRGANIKQGQLLMTISGSGLASNNLKAEVDQARANYEQARSEYERKKQLYELKIVPKAEFEQVENRYRVIKSTFETLSSGYADGGLQVRAPFNGYIKSINVGNGDYVDQGADLVTVGTLHSRLLETHVSISQAHNLENIHNIWYQREPGKWSGLNESGGSIISVGKAIEQFQPLLPVYARVTEAVVGPEGGFTEVQIAVGSQRESTLAPLSALLENFGTYEVIVQLAGETYERRPVSIGRRNGELVEITRGLEPGEMVVTEGAYQVKMASMSGQIPAHGHVH
jgi:membrane fusion protein, heavy metal efflux system